MKRNIIMILGSVMCVVLASIAYLKIANTTNDALKFKEEYEALNGTEAYEKKYKELNISRENPIKYSNYDEILDIIKNKTGIIYFGFPECPWCRNALPVLFDVAKENDIDTIYYLNILNERDSYTVEDGKLVYATDEDGNEKKGTEGYFKLLKALDEHLTEYTIVYEEETYEVGEKRLFAPSVVFVKDGDVLGVHVSTVTSQTDPYEDLTEEQYNELYDIYEGYIFQMNNSACSLDSAC
ncbi:MAG: hypothetical protein IJY25_04905 [Bacilli bacterium]|nr:hypothetical protein [Bacilli bacterium]